MCTCLKYERLLFAIACGISYRNAEFLVKGTWCCWSNMRFGMSPKCSKLMWSNNLRAFHIHKRYREGKFWAFGLDTNDDIFRAAPTHPPSHTQSRTVFIFYSFRMVNFGIQVWSSPWIQIRFQFEFGFELGWVWSSRDSFATIHYPQYWVGPSGSSSNLNFGELSQIAISVSSQFQWSDFTSKQNSAKFWVL